MWKRNGFHLWPKHQARQLARRVSSGDKTMCSCNKHWQYCLHPRGEGHRNWLSDNIPPYLRWGRLSRAAIRQWVYFHSRSNLRNVLGIFKDFGGQCPCWRVEVRALAMLQPRWHFFWSFNLARCFWFWYVRLFLWCLAGKRLWKKFLPYWDR